MDAKTGYSTIVTGSKTVVETNKELNRKIRSGENRKAIHGASWESVNINTVVDRFAPGATPRIINGKVTYDSLDGRYKIFADIGGGYLRIYDTLKGCYVDAYGNDVRNYIDERGKQHGRSSSEQKTLTHFRILKRKEMK